ALFAANISHELRTPLSIIVGFAETMLFAPESYGRQLPAVYRSDLIEIYNSSRHLLGLIDDVLDLSQIEAGRMGLVKEPTDVAEVIREAAEMLQKLTQRKGLYLRVEIEEPLPIMDLDRTRIRQVLLNLLNNAARYTAQGGIAVEARVHDEDLVISVSDTGPGISAEHLERIFQSYYQVESSVTRRQGGIGLGLALSRYFVEMHGGGIWAESQPGVGSRFCFTLPLEKELRERGERRTPLLRGALPRSPADGRQVLLVHPDPTTAVMLKRHLDDTHVIQAADLSAAAAELRTARARAVITDCESLPAALGLAGNGEGMPWLPGTVLIGCSLPSGPLPAVALGVQGFLVKPVARKKLLATLEACAPGARRVLVVDDDPRVVRLLARMLLSAPGRYQILRAFDGHEALRLMRSERPDVVLLDLYMPQLDGFSVLEHMEADAALAQIPVVVVSAKGLPEDGVLRLHGPITIQQPGGFTLAELFRYLQAVLGAAGPPQPAG
ncbi:MAG: hybrid sensor histidine kinase/response regulator, partial [Anaerolineae bacterium]|nr:hybrid sensor histidine kinase/response regulator [Anaerolineae bacterium]